MRQSKKTSADREGDTSRTSSQGRKLASGRDSDKKRGSAEIDEQSKSEKRELHPKKR